MSSINSEVAQHEQFERRCVQLAKEFGTAVDAFEALPDQFKDFFRVIGYIRVCTYLVIADLGRGRSENEIARRYGITRRQVRTIKANSRLCKIRAAAEV